MLTQSPEERVDTLEQQLIGLLELPAKVDGLALQISQLRKGLRVEAAAIRGEMTALATTLRKEKRADDMTLGRKLRDEMKAANSAVAATLRKEMRVGNAALRKEIREGNQETRRLMRVLHEDVVGRIALLAEGRSAAPSAKPSPSRKGAKSSRLRVAVGRAPGSGSADSDS